LFWLDAHWSGGETFGEEDECPLLDEIAVIDGDGPSHIILIDDARMFLAPPDLPHEAESWPTIDEVCHALTARRTAFVSIFEDVIIRVPPEMRSSVTAYCRGIGASKIDTGSTVGLPARNLLHRMWRASRRASQGVSPSPRP
jgi:hypothetical protein